MAVLFQVPATVSALCLALHVKLRKQIMIDIDMEVCKCRPAILIQKSCQTQVQQLFLLCLMAVSRVDLCMTTSLFLLNSVNVCGQSKRR